MFYVSSRCKYTLYEIKIANGSSKVRGVTFLYIHSGLRQNLFQMLRFRIFGTVLIHWNAVSTIFEFDSWQLNQVSWCKLGNITHVPTVFARTLETSGRQFTTSWWYYFHFQKWGLSPVPHLFKSMLAQLTTNYLINWPRRIRCSRLLYLAESDLTEHFSDFLEFRRHGTKYFRWWV